MKRLAIPRVQSLTLACLAGVLWAQPVVVVRPRPIDDVLINPGIGVQTFQRFAGQPIYPGMEWSEVGPEGKLADAAAKVDFPPSSVAYLRWFWHQLELRSESASARNVLKCDLRKWLPDDALWEGTVPVGPRPLPAPSRYPRSVDQSASHSTGHCWTSTGWLVHAE